MITNSKTDPNSQIAANKLLDRQELGALSSKCNLTDSNTGLGDERGKKPKDQSLHRGSLRNTIL